MKNKMNKHVFPFQLKELGSEGEFTGYGSVFGNEDSYGDVVEKGAFENTIREHSASGSMPSLLWQHDTRQPIGVWEEMKEDDHGLLMRGRLLTENVRQAKEAHALLQAGALNGLSIGFTVNTNGMHFDKEANVMRITDVKLWEVSVVTFPANEQALVGNVKERIISGEALELRQFEKFLRDEGGFSRTEAERVAKYGFKGLELREEEIYTNEDLHKLTEHIKQLTKG